MSYKAIVTKVRLSELPGADRLMLALVAGHQVVCAKTAYKDGDLVVFFPVGGQLTHAVCHHNNLYREGKGENHTAGVYGYFDENRRVRSIKLCKQKSEGFMVPLSGFTFTGADLHKLKAGQLLTEIGGVKICNKYETQATKQARLKAGGKARKDIPEFNKVGDTSKTRFLLNSIPAGAVITLSEKIHGTSGRTGFIHTTIERPEPLSFWERIMCGFRRKYKPIKDKGFRYLSGSRRMIVAEGIQVANLKPDGTEIPLGYRQLIHNEFIGCLYQGESLYYEIVVCNNEGTPDFRQAVGDNKSDAVLRNLRKTYGERMLYRYGVEAGSCKVFVYRITRQNNRGDHVELSWNNMRRRANELGLECVPTLDQFIYDGNTSALRDKLDRLSDGPSTLDSTHIREGLAVHVDAPTMQGVSKYKGFSFCHLEGIAKNSDTYVDPEDIA